MSSAGQGSRTRARRDPPQLGSLNFERSSSPQHDPVSPLTPDFRSGGFSRTSTPRSNQFISGQRRSYSVPSVVLASTSSNAASNSDVPPLPPVSKIQSRVRAHKARAILKQFQDEEEQRLAEVHGVRSPQRRNANSQSVYGEPSIRQSQVMPVSPLQSQPFRRQSQFRPVSPLQPPSPSTPGYGPRVSEYGLPYRFGNRSRDDLLWSRTGSTPDLLRHTIYSSPAVSREHLVLRNTMYASPAASREHLDTTMPAEIEGDEYFHSELPTEGAEVIEMDGGQEPVELGSSPVRKELSASPSVRQKPPRYRPPQFDYLDSDGVSKYNTLPGEAFPLITNSAAMDPEELPSGDERAPSPRRRTTLEEEEASEAIRKSIEPEADPRGSRSMSNG